MKKQKVLIFWPEFSDHRLLWEKNDSTTTSSTKLSVQLSTRMDTNTRKLLHTPSKCQIARTALMDPY